MDRATQRSLMARLKRDAEHIAWRFGLEYKSIEAERANVKNRYGICYEDGLIKIRLRHVTTGKPLRYSSLVNTLCHELAHLRHFNHGERFRIFYRQLLEFARAEGIYRPSVARRAAAAEPNANASRNAGRPIATPAATPAESGRPAPAGPVQLTLF
jgi:hypothetical protein